MWLLWTAENALSLEQARLLNLRKSVLKNDAGLLRTSWPLP